MTPSQLFAYAPDGNTIVLAEGNELLVHDGQDESPRFRHTLNAPIFAVFATVKTVIALDESGAVSLFNPAKDEILKTLESGGAPTAFAAHADGRIAVGLDAAIVLFDGDGSKREINIASASALAFSGDASLLAAGKSDGSIQVISAESGESVAQTNIGEPVRSIAWNAGNFWIASGGDRVFRIEQDGDQHDQLTRASGMNPDCIVCSPDGSLLGMRLDAATVVVLAYPSKNTAATIQYIERKAYGLAFGPAPYFGIGMDLGDGNKINLSTKAVHRTDTHPGRDHHRWMLSVAIDKSSLPAAYGGGSAPEKSRASEPPISSNSPTSPSKDGAPVQTILGFVLVGIGILILLVTQCG